ncbi:unnamed protein product, partial [Sphagnum tenellum]
MATTKEEEKKVHLRVEYRKKPYAVEMVLQGSTIGDLGNELQRLTGVLPRTMRLFLPPQGRNRVAASFLLPGSEQHASLALSESGLTEGQVIRMMGALPEEITEVSLPSTKRVDNRILGFAEEDYRAKQRATLGAGHSRQLPQGPYVFSQFQTLQLPNLNPPPQQALGIMHKLASDPGIIAIMKKHRWQVGVMTELAPVGYVGVSPKCLLGFNKNRGEEISLRLRTDDLQGFRKYESIKKTLLHELAHMVHDEHDEKFHSLDKQLNQEAEALDWTRSKGHSLSGARYAEELDEDTPMDVGGVKSGHKLGGNPTAAGGPRSAAAEAALFSKLEPDPDDSEKTDKLTSLEGKVEPDPDDSIGGMGEQSSHSFDQRNFGQNHWSEPDPDEEGEADRMKGRAEPDQDEASQHLEIGKEPDPDEVSYNTTVSHKSTRELCRSQATSQEGDENPNVMRDAEPDPDDEATSVHEDKESDADEMLDEPNVDKAPVSLQKNEEPNLDKMREEPDPDEAVGFSQDSAPCEASLDVVSREQKADQDTVLDLEVVDDELIRIQDAAAAATARLQGAIAMLKQQASPSEMATVVQTLFTILRNVMDHPNDSKFRHLRKV